MKARVVVTLKNGILDPQGKAIEGALKSLGIAGIESLRQGKIFEIELTTNDPTKAEGLLRGACEKLLANQVVENFQVVLPTFAEHVGRIPDLFAKLNEATPFAFSPVGLPQEPAVYAFIEDQKILRIGRTGNLKRRIQSHVRQDHHSATFAFNLARKELGCPPTYQKEGSRNALQQDPIFMQCFGKQIARLKRMHLKYILIDDPIDQYLIELYASMFYGLALDEYDNH